MIDFQSEDEKGMLNIHNILVIYNIILLEDYTSLLAYQRPL